MKLIRKLQKEIDTFNMVNGTYSEKSIIMLPSTLRKLKEEDFDRQYLVVKKSTKMGNAISPQVQVEDVFFFQDIRIIPSMYVLEDKFIIID